MIKLNVKEDFTIMPGARYYMDGDFSGQEFYETILEMKYDEAIEKGKLLEINLDGTFGYASSFTSEAFGRLYFEKGGEDVWENIVFISKENRLLIDRIKAEAKDYTKSNNT